MSRESPIVTLVCRPSLFMVDVPRGGAWGRVSVIPHDAEAFARAIYAELHRCDEAGVQLIVVEQLPEHVQEQQTLVSLQELILILQWEFG